MTDLSGGTSAPAQDQSPPPEKKTSKIIYRAQPGDPLSVTWHGVQFVSGAEVSSEDEVLIEAARGNPHFDVDGEDKAEARDQKVRDAARVQAEGTVASLKAQAAEMEERQSSEVDALEAKHQAERDAFENANSGAWNAAQAVIDRGGAPPDQSQGQAANSSGKTNSQPDPEPSTPFPTPAAPGEQSSVNTASDQPQGSATQSPPSTVPQTVQDDINQKSPEDKVPQAAALDGASTLPSVDEPMPLPQSPSPAPLASKRPR